ncbi:retrovirus-related pol polyprotein from transposon TNT 1-94 [Tanacetum coccineum]
MHAELSATEKLQAYYDCKATNIILQGLPPDVYAIVNHHKVAKEIWDRVKLLMQGTKLSLQEKECKLYDEFDKFLFVKGLAVHVFSQGDDPIACLNKVMAFLTVVASSRVTVQQVQGRQGQSYSGTGYKGNATSSGGTNTSRQARVVKCYNCQYEGHMARQYTQPKLPINTACLQEKACWLKAQEARKILDEEQLAFLADPGILDGQVAQTTILNNAAFQTKDLDAYDSRRYDVSNAKAVLMANLSSYGSDVISEEKANQEKNNKSVTAELERYKERIKTFEQRLNVDLSSREKMIDSQMDDMIKEKLALKELDIVDSFLVVASSCQLCEWSAMTYIDSRACVGVIRGMNPLESRIL